MDAIREQLQKPLIAIAFGFVIGLVIGWFVIGWGLWPVEWTDAAPEHLRADAREDYLRMAINSYAKTGDITAAQLRWDDLGAEAEQVLADIEANPRAQGINDITAFRTAIETFPVEEEVVVEPEAEEEGGLSPLFIAMCAVTVILAVALAGYFWYRQRSGYDVPSPRPREAFRPTDVPGVMVEEGALPLSQFMTTYMLGDDLYDDSFSIDSPSGEFLGECGVGISETIGVGEPKKVSAVEVWLFDKNDIQTVTKVLMSTHAYNDEAVRQRLAAKGEPIIAEPGREMELATASLRLVARVVDMAYGGTGGLPSDSFFDRLTLDLTVWQEM